jgi:iron(III) transport system permease protein
MLRWLVTIGLILLALLLALPVVSLGASWLQLGGEGHQVLRQMAQTVLPTYTWTTVVLCVSVGLGTALVGLVSACAVTIFDFPGRRSFEWALLLPMAMPAYVVAYAYTDFLQFSGPLQTALRDTFGWQGRVFPEVRNTPGAIWVFTFTLYPYVYLLTRTALAERAVGLMEAARMLGAPLRRRIAAVALPLARPAVVAGVALALMETLADFGVSSYFGIQTFTAGIYKAWLAMNMPLAAAQLATMLLALVAMLLWLEQRAQARMRFSTSRGQNTSAADAQPTVLRGGRAAVAVAVCLLPILAGFVLPTLFMLRPMLSGWEDVRWSMFWEWTGNSVWLAGVSAALAVTLALVLAFAQRVRGDGLARAVVRVVGLGYAVPGAVVVIGILLPLGWIQARWPDAGLGYLITATAVGIVWAYLVRFTSVALHTVQSGYARIPHSLDEAARVLDVTGMRLAQQVHAPLLLRSVAAAALLVFVDVMKELPATLVLRPFNSDTLAVAAYQLARDERLGEAALPSLALVLVGLVPVMLLSRALRRSAPKVATP